MSFSKAKIQRFNDVKITSRLGSKNTVSKVKVAISDKSSEKSCETASVKSTPCFRQPNVIHKKPSVNGTKPKPQPYSKSNIELEALKEKIVECENKDACIKDLSEQLDEIKTNMLTLENTNSKLLSELGQYEDVLETLNLKHAKNLEKLSETFEENLIVLRSKEKKLREDLETLKNDSKLLKEANQKDLDNLKNDLNKCETLTSNLSKDYNNIILAKSRELQQKEQELKALELNCIEMQKQHSTEIEKLQKEHQLEIQDIEFEMLKTMTELQRERENVDEKIKQVENKMAWELNNMSDEFEKEKKNILLQAEEQIKEVEQKYSQNCLLFESQWQERNKEIENEWKMKLLAQEKESDTILKECQAISEYNIIQCELEKNDIQEKLAAKTEELLSLKEKYKTNQKTLDELNIKYKKLQNDLSKIIVELNDTRKIFGEQISAKDSQIAQMTKDKLKYEITIKNSQITVDVLKRRLINSDKDVEQLKSELEKCEEKLLKYEQTCLQLTSELKQSQTYNEELEMQYESTIKLNRTEIEQISKDLIKKVDSYKEEVGKLTNKFEKERTINQEMMEHLHNAYKLINQLKNDIETFEPVNVHYQFEMQQSRNELDDYRMREMDWNILKDKYESIIKDLEQNLETRMDEISQLKKQTELLSHQNQNISISENDEEICKKYIQISGKYDELQERFLISEGENLEKTQIITELTKALQENNSVKEKYEKQKQENEILMKKIQWFENQMKNKENNDTLKKKVRKLEEEKHELANKVAHLECELKEISQKYTDLVGHQNNKQKIKHLEDLKIKNGELKQNNTELENKNRSQTKTIEKLKKEVWDLQKRLKKNKFPVENKENICSPNRSLNSSRVESPFRDRN